MFPHRGVAMIEAFFVYGFILVYVWFVKPSVNFYAQYSYVPVLIGILCSHVLRRENLQTIGIKVWDLVWPSKIIYYFALLLCLSAFFYGAAKNHTRDPNVYKISEHFVNYLWWGTFQQYLLGYFANRVNLALNSCQSTAIICAMMFSLIHLPNPILCGVCLVTGYFAVLLFFKYRNIIAIGILHAMFGVTINLLNFSMDLGHSYFH